MTQQRRPLALITGASSGIGLELARLHAARGGDLVVVARRRERLEALAAELASAHGVQVHAVPLDLSKPESAAQVSAEVDARRLEVDYLINNAGFGGHGYFHERDWSSDRAMITVNVLTLTELTRWLLPGMLRRGSGRILNVASVAGFVPGPFQAVYYATKAYVISLTQALASELAGTGVTATVLCPGVTDTEFARVADVEEVRAFTGPVADPVSVASYGYEAMLAGKVIAVPGLGNKVAAHIVPRILPRRMVTRLSRARMEKDSR